MRIGSEAPKRRTHSFLTNANVESVVSGIDSQTIMVKYKDGEKKVIVPPPPMPMVFRLT